MYIGSKQGRLSSILRGVQRNITAEFNQTVDTIPYIPLRCNVMKFNNPIIALAYFRYDLEPLCIS